jgi:hypothetical protein
MQALAPRLLAVRQLKKKQQQKNKLHVKKTKQKKENFHLLEK